MAASHQLPPLSITLVHGTHARGTFFVTSKPCFGPASDWWFRPNSSFRLALDASLRAEGREADVQELDWSGANSVNARAEAAESLTCAVAADHADKRDAEQILVAHSHGGNVAMLAADALRQLGIRVRVVTMATPYLRVAQREAGWPPFAVFLLCLPLFFWPLAALDQLLADNVPGWSWLNASWLLTLGGLFFIVGPWFSWTESHRKRLVEAVNFSPVRSGRVLVLRGFVDEATLLLAAGAIGAELIQLLFIVLMLPVRLASLTAHWLGVSAGWPVAQRLFGRAAEGLVKGLVPWLVYAGFLLVLGLVLSLVTPLGGARAVGRHLTFAWYVMPAIAIGLLIVAGLAFAVHGRELFPHALGLMVSTDSVPDSAGKLDVVTLDIESAGVTGLRHGLYKHPDCATIVARWICRGKLTQPTRPGRPRRA